jgi:hypothetical protein
MEHIRKHLKGLADVNAVTVSGSTLQIKGRAAPGEDARRLTAILRSMPLLRGFTIEPHFSML